MAVPFVHLNLHTEYSLVDSIIRIDELLDKIVEFKQPAVAITDFHNLFAAIKFYQAAHARGIKPILGTEVLIADESAAGAEPFHLILLAQNYAGYHNLLNLISKAYLHGQKSGTPILERAWLPEYSENLIALSGGLDGDVGKALLNEELNAVEQYLDFWKHYFSNRYYIEISRTGRVEDERYLEIVVPFAAKHVLPLVATNRVCFLNESDFEAHEARVCINSGYTLNDPKRPRHYLSAQYLRSSSEMAELFRDLPESLQNSYEIAKRCNIEIPLGKTSLPIFPLPDESSTPEELLMERARTGLLERINFSDTEVDENGETKEQRYRKRLEYEVATIIQMGFASYFLIVSDFIQWSKRHGVPVGPGRGSGAGSLVAYTLHITDIDPLVHDLLFERFLNPERISMPDIDVDFCMDNRDRTIAYVAERYGKDKVSQIVTFGTLAAKVVVRDVGRVLNYPYGFVDKIAKLIPFTLGITLDEALRVEPILKERYEKEDEVKNLIDLARKLEGLVRNTGKHAGGVVIAPSALTDFTPLCCESDGSNVVTQFDKYDVEKVGLVKFDFLGLRTLTMISWTLDAINQRMQREGKPTLDLTKIDLEDQDTYRLLQSGETEAVFQLESRICRDVIKRFLPNCFSDMVALVAIIRPGVLQSGMLDEIIGRKRGEIPIQYLHPKLEGILKSTYGVAIYQEQVMQMAQVLAGYSLGSADLLRRAMGKKKPEEMAKQRAVFVVGAKKYSDVDAELAGQIFDYMEKFASYGFNKSHSAAYALISYQTAWLKTHFAPEFLAAMLSSDMDRTGKIVELLAECKRLQIKVINPHINLSDYNFTVNLQGEIVYGLSAIKGVGEAAAKFIARERKKNGDYRSLFDLCRRIDPVKINKRILEALICSGAFDVWKVARPILMQNVEIALKFGADFAQNSLSGQLDLFGGESDALEDHYEPAETWSHEQNLQQEKAVLGFYLSGHPLEPLAAELRHLGAVRMDELAKYDRKTVEVAGLITNIKILNTKSGSRLAIVSLEDTSGTADVTFFDEEFNRQREILVKDQVIIAHGEVSADNFTGGWRIKGEKVLTIDEARTSRAKSLLLKMRDKHVSSENLSKLQCILLKFVSTKGCPVLIDYEALSYLTRIRLGDRFRVLATEELLSTLRCELVPDLILSVEFCY